MSEDPFPCSCIVDPFPCLCTLECSQDLLNLLAYIVIYFGKMNLSFFIIPKQTRNLKIQFNKHQQAIFNTIQNRLRFLEKTMEIPFLIISHKYACTKTTDQ